MDEITTTAPAADRLPRPGGTLAYDVRGAGPLVVCVPGMGDTRRDYDALADALVAAGHRVATLDLRGHGGSDTTFTDHTRPEAGADVVALVEHLIEHPVGHPAEPDGRAHLIGCSYGASAVAWAAGTRPDLVAGLTLIGPFVRDLPVPAVQRLALSAMLARPWGARAWTAWFRRLHRRPPADLDARVAHVGAMIREPGRLAALRAMAATDCVEVDAALDGITAPTLVVMGTADPDVGDPAAEAAAIAARVDGRARGRVHLVEGAGHYPHVEAPDEALPAIVAHVAETR